ncbi:MAG: hypothetical protein Q8Q33_01585, partial [Chlamydiota bacterium]|nr:hypothetical protein [Chlamydiota bacterium]
AAPRQPDREGIGERLPNLDPIEPEVEEEPDNNHNRNGAGRIPDHMLPGSNGPGNFRDLQPNLEPVEPRLPRNEGNEDNANNQNGRRRLPENLLPRRPGANDLKPNLKPIVPQSPLIPNHGNNQNRSNRRPWLTQKPPVPRIELKPQTIPLTMAPLNGNRNGSSQGRQSNAQARNQRALPSFQSNRSALSETSTSSGRTSNILSKKPNLSSRSLMAGPKTGVSKKPYTVLNTSRPISPMTSKANFFKVNQAKKRTIS